MSIRSSGRKLHLFFQVRNAAVLYGDPGQEGVFVMRLKFPANYRVPPHTHPVDEIVTVISGEFNIGMGKEFDEFQTKPYTAGAFIAMPPGNNTSSTRIKRLSFKLVPGARGRLTMSIRATRRR